MRTSTIAAIGFTLAIIPTTALAAYALDNTQGKPAISYIVEMGRVDGQHYNHVVAQIEKPQSRLDNLWTEYKSYKNKQEYKKMMEHKQKPVAIVAG